jgi:hypothetical protein
LHTDSQLSTQNPDLKKPTLLLRRLVQVSVGLALATVLFFVGVGRCFPSQLLVAFTSTHTISSVFVLKVNNNPVRFPATSCVHVMLHRRLLSSFQLAMLEWLTCGGMCPRLC